MQDESRTVTTLCPHCGGPIMWVVRKKSGERVLEAVSWPCRCTLSYDDWDALGRQIDKALGAPEAETTK